MKSHKLEADIWVGSVTLRDGHVNRPPTSNIFSKPWLWFPFDHTVVSWRGGGIDWNDWVWRCKSITIPEISKHYTTMIGALQTLCQAGSLKTEDGLHYVVVDVNHNFYLEKFPHHCGVEVWVE